MNFSLINIKMQQDKTKREQKIHKICITGGPCAGKTTSMNKIRDKILDSGKHMVYMVPELASLTFGAGVSIIPSEFTPEDHAILIEAMIRQQMSLEDYFAKIATIQKKDVVLLIDRGVMDSPAYCAKETMKTVLERTKFNINDLRDHRYDMVLHMITAADGAEEFYTLENNQARSETPEVARDIDLKLQAAWNGHPNHVIIGNWVQNFDDKVALTCSKICQEVGLENMTLPTQKFVLNSEVDEQKLLGELNLGMERYEETTTFLKESEEGQASWINLRISECGTQYMSYSSITTEGEGESGQKQKIRTRRSIQGHLYQEYLKNRDEGRLQIKSSVIVFVYKGGSYRVEKFGKISGFESLSMITVHPQNKTTGLEFPDFIEVGEEVTESDEHCITNLSLRR